MANIEKFLDKAFEQKEFAELVNAPVAALEGVSDADADALQKGVRHQDRRRPGDHQVGPLGPSDHDPGRRQVGHE